jgi:hypothetical protein
MRQLRHSKWRHIDFESTGDALVERPHFLPKAAARIAARCVGRASVE